MHAKIRKTKKFDVLLLFSKSPTLQTFVIFERNQLEQSLSVIKVTVENNDMGTYRGICFMPAA